MLSALVSAIPTAVPSPSIAECGGGADEDLLELGRKFDQLASAARDAQRRSAPLWDAFDEFLETGPDALRFRTRDFRMPFNLHPMPLIGRFLFDGHVEQIRARRYDHNGDRSFTSGVTGNDAQRRADEIMRAHDLWKPIRDARRAELGIDQVGKELESTTSQIMEVEETIFAAFDARSRITHQGVVVLARVILSRFGDEFGEESPEQRWAEYSRMLAQANVDIAGTEALT